MSRISLQQAFSQGLRGILNVQSQMFKTQDQVSSGKRVLTPADDPIAAARILQLDQASSETTQYKKNIDAAQTNLDLEDARLDSTANLLARVRELTVQAGDGGLAAPDRQAVYAELTNILDQLVSIANTRNTSGEYIFGGYKGQQAPFVKNGTNYSYVGDTGQRMVQISSTTSVPISDSGSAVFVDIQSPRLPATAAAGNTGNATISSGRVVNQATFDASYSGTYQVNFTSATTYDIVPAGGGPAVVTGAAYTSGSTITFNGVEMRITGTPATGDSFQIAPPSTQSMIDTVAKIANTLSGLTDSADDRLRLQDLVAETLDNIDAAEANIGVVRSNIGARMNTLDSTKDLHDGVDAVNQKVLSDVRDLDYAEAITRLTKEQFILQAAQQTFSKISNMSLFDFLR
jgi:flagellar hook-associated protein 3 FlgL